MSEQDEAQAKWLQQLGCDLAGPLAETILAASETDGGICIEDAATNLSGGMLSAAWQMTLFACAGDQERAKTAFVGLLRGAATRIEGLE